MVLEVPVTSADCLEIIHLRACVALLAIPRTRPALGAAAHAKLDQVRPCSVAVHRQGLIKNTAGIAA